MAVVSLPAKAIETAIVVTSVEVMNSGRAVLASMNFDRRSGCCWVVGREVVGRISLVFEEGG